MEQLLSVNQILILKEVLLENEDPEEESDGREGTKRRALEEETEGEERRLMHLVPALAVSLMKS